MHVSRCWIVLAVGFASILSRPSSGASTKPLVEPAKVQIVVSPESLDPGGLARVTLSLAPVEGVKINRYPKIKLSVPSLAGVVDAAEVSLGNDAPPPVGATESNYFESVDPLDLELRLDPRATVGPHEIAGQLTYFYCVSQSGFCAPARVAIKIPLRVH